ncbi:hypothetical protein D3C87_1075190 [compost metagenome]
MVINILMEVKPMKNIKVIKRDGSIIISKQGYDIDILELTTCLMTDRVTYEGNTAYIHVKGK